MESVLGCVVISMENYRNGTDDGNDLDSIDFDTLVRNLQVFLFLTSGLVLSFAYIIEGCGWS